MLFLVRLAAAASLAAISYVHWKLISGQVLTPAEQSLFNMCCR